MKKYKYIIVSEMGVETPVIFPLHLNHCDVAGKMHVVSAGECWLPNDLGPAAVQGHSVTLGLSSRPEDAEIISEYFPYQKD